MTTDATAPDLSDVQSGLEGVVAFATEIAEPDKAGGALRYRGVDIENLVGTGPARAVRRDRRARARQAAHRGDDEDAAGG